MSNSSYFGKFLYRDDFISTLCYYFGTSGHLGPDVAAVRLDLDGYYEIFCDAMYFDGNGKAWDPFDLTDTQKSLPKFTRRWRMDLQGTPIETVMSKIVINIGAYAIRALDHRDLISLHKIAIEAELVEAQYEVHKLQSLVDEYEMYQPGGVAEKAAAKSFRTTAQLAQLVASQDQKTSTKSTAKANKLKRSSF